MQNITIAGNCTKDAVLRRTQGGEPVLSFSVAVNGRDDKSTFYDCSLWGKRGEALSKYITKGGKLTVAGELGTREHDGRTYLTVRVSEVTLQGSKAEASNRSSYDDPEPRRQPSYQDELSDEVPF